MLQFLKRKNTSKKQMSSSEQYIETKTNNNDYSKTMGFLRDMNNQIENIIKQHNVVNNEHQILSELAGEIKNQMKVISDLTYKTNSSTDNLYNFGEKLLTITKETVGSSMDGKKSIENIIDAVSLLGQETTNTYESIKRLEERLKEISSIVLLINGIASQTNLLALNAAIEAARAGENGRGFAIVAEEIRKLAEMTSNSTKNIDKLISGVQGESKYVFANANKSTQVISNGIKISKEALEKIDTTLNSFDKVNENVKQVINIISTQKDHVEGIVHNISCIESILEKTHNQIEHHIQQASLVDKKLDDSINKLSIFTQNSKS